MTLQVALVGTDGILLASDKKINQSAERAAYTGLTSKIRVNYSRRIATCWAQYAPAADVAKQALELSDTDLLDPRGPLENLAEKIFEEARGENQFAFPNGDVILVTIGELPAVHLLTVEGKQYRCSRRDDKAIAGNNVNSALFFIQRYYKKLPIDDLTPLAAHTILSAGYVNQTGVEGLEILRCTKEGFDFLEEKEISALTAWSCKLDTKIGRLVFSGPAANSRVI